MAIHPVSELLPTPGRSAGINAEKSAPVAGNDVSFASLLLGVSATAGSSLPADGKAIGKLAAGDARTDSTHLSPDAGAPPDPPVPLFTATPTAIALAALSPEAVRTDSPAASVGIDVSPAAMPGTVSGLLAEEAVVLPWLRAAHRVLDWSASDCSPTASKRDADAATAQPVDDGASVRPVDGLLATMAALAGENSTSVSHPDDHGHLRPVSTSEQSPAVNGLSTAEPFWPSFGAVSPSPLPAQPLATPLDAENGSLAAQARAAVDATGLRRQWPSGEFRERVMRNPADAPDGRASALSPFADQTQASPTDPAVVPQHDRPAQAISAADQPPTANFAEIGKAGEIGEPIVSPPVAAEAETPALPATAASSLSFSPAFGPNPNGHLNPYDVPKELLTPLRDPAWNVEFGQKLLWFAHNDHQQAHLTINPPHLGAIEISVNLHQDNSASAVFVAANADVRSALESSLPRLREMFASAGIDLGQVSVGSESFRQSSEGGQRSARAPRGMADKAILGSDLTGVPLAAGLVRLGNGLVDTFA